MVRAEPKSTRLNQWKFTFLLVALVFLMAVHPLVAQGPTSVPGLYHLLLIIVALAAIFTLFQHTASRIPALILGIPAIAGILIPYAFAAMPPIPHSLIFDLMPTLFLLYAALTILATIFRERRYSIDGVVGALAGYLLIGLAFGHLYCLVEACHPNSFHLATNIGALPEGSDRQHGLLTYFSLITLTTLGYGDITPQSPPARTLVWLEAVLGQFYLAVIIAGLVGLRVSTALQDSEQSPANTKALEQPPPPDRLPDQR